MKRENTGKLEGGRIRPHCVKNSHCKEPWDCHKTYCRSKELVAHTDPSNFVGVSLQEFPEERKSTNN